MSDPVTTEQLNTFCELRHDPINTSLSEIKKSIRELYGKTNKIYFAIIGLLCTMVCNLALVLILNNAYKTIPNVEIKIDKNTIQDVLTLKKPPGMK